MSGNLKELYAQIKTPEELLEFMSKYIKFGFYGINKRLYDTSDLDAFTMGLSYWNLSDTDDTLTNGYGNLFDQVELERDWFIKNGYECKVFYIGFIMDKSNSLPNHAYLVYKDSNKWKWFEVIDKANYGIHDFTLLDMLVAYQMNDLIAIANRFNPVDSETMDTLHVYEYSKPNSSINSKDIMEFIKNSQEIHVLE